MTVEEYQKIKSEKLARSYAVKSPLQSAAIKDIDMTKRTVTGFFNTFNFFDSDADVMMKGASNKTIADRGPESNAVAKIKHAVQHDLNRLPGRIEVLQEKIVGGIEGMYFETRMAETTLGNDTLINYQEKVYDNHSIGFRYKNLEFHEDGTDGFDRIVATLINPDDAKDRGFLWEVKEIELFEGSTVAFGANSLTPALGVKSGNKELIKMKLSERINVMYKQLQKGNQSDEQMKIFEIQLLQLDQMIKELNFEPSIKDTITQETEEGRSDTHKSEHFLISLLK